MKQRDTTVLMGMLTMLSFAMGHATLSVKDFWNEPVIVWMAIVLPTGKNFVFTHCINIDTPLTFRDHPLIGNTSGEILPLYLMWFLVGFSLSWDAPF